MSELPITDIADAYSNAVRIRVEELKETDKVFDMFGRLHRVSKIRHMKGGGVSFQRDDLLYRDRRAKGSIINVVRAEEEA